MQWRRSRRGLVLSPSNEGSVSIALIYRTNLAFVLGAKISGSMDSAVRYLMLVPVSSLEWLDMFDPGNLFACTCIWKVVYHGHCTFYVELMLDIE